MVMEVKGVIFFVAFLVPLLGPTRSGDVEKIADFGPSVKREQVEGKDAVSKGSEKKDGFISKETAEKLHILYGGIGPVLNPPGLSPMNPLPMSEPQETHKSVYRKTRGTRNVKRESKTEGTERNKPEQIHISYGETPAEMTVMWSTPLQGSSEVLYGKSRHKLDKHTEGDSTIFNLMNPQGLQYIHRVTLMGLTPDQKYYYLVKTGSEKSEILHFKTMKAGYDWSPTLLIFGDMGVVGGAPSLRILNKAARNGSVDAIIHVGDFAYDLHDEGGKVGDDFMNRIQYVASRIPYMTCVGNHEIAGGTFSHYRYRFSMPGVVWPAPINQLWYSFNMGLVHFISYSTEVHFTDGPVEEQLNWLRQDLNEANANRDKRPWVIAFGHRPMYCSNNDRDDCTKLNSVVREGFEKLFYDAGVDIIIEAHEHSYERFWPMYQGKVSGKNYRNPQAPVHIIGGAAGCNEFDKVCVNPIFGPKGPWSAFRSWLPGLYGVGKLFAANATHLHWQQLLAVNSQTLDQFWIEQHHHGPFPHQDTGRLM